MQANVKFGDRYVPKSEMMDNNIIVKISFLRSVKSAMGMHDMAINRFISEYKNEERLSSMMEDILTKMGKKQESW